MSEAPAAPAPALAPPSAEPSPLGGTQTPPAPAPAPAPAPEGAPAETPPAGESTESAPEAAAYTAFKLPDGMAVDDAVMGQFTEFAKTNGLSQEAAQAALDLHTSQLAAQATTYAKAQETAWTTTIQGWQAERAAMPEFAGDKGAAAQVVIGRALDTYGSQEARDAFDLTGAGHNPHILKFVYSMAAALDEGTPLPGGGPAPRGARTPGQVLYGEEQGTA